MNVTEVAVCSACLYASCFQGELFCEDYRRASVVWKTPDELRKLTNEHPSVWENATTRSRR